MLENGFGEVRRHYHPGWVQLSELELQQLLQDFITDEMITSETTWKEEIVHAARVTRKLRREENDGGDLCMGVD